MPPFTKSSEERKRTRGLQGREVREVRDGREGTGARGEGVGAKIRGPISREIFVVWRDDRHSRTGNEFAIRMECFTLRMAVYSER